MLKVTNIETGKTIKGVEYVDSFCGLIRGLMFREDGALLMDFGKDCKPGIWTLFMKFPLDIVFIDSSKKVVEVRHDALPLSLNPKSWRIYRPSKKCRFVLEVRSGIAKELGAEPGSKLMWNE